MLSLLESDMILLPRCKSVALLAVSALLAASTAALTASPAAAISLAVELACATDYYSYCSQYNPAGSDVRKCMRSNGERLSKVCVKALLNAGEVTQAEIDARTAAAAPRK